MIGDSRVEHLCRLINRITYKPGYLILLAGVHPHEVEAGHPITATVHFRRVDTFTGDVGTGHSRPVEITADMTDGDVVRAMFGLLASIEEHECREAFQVDGVRVFGPHIELDALLEAGRHVQGHPEPG